MSKTPALHDRRYIRSQSVAPRADPELPDLRSHVYSDRDNLIAYGGISALSGLYQQNRVSDLSYSAERWASSLANSVPDTLVLAAVLTVAFHLITVAYRNRRNKPRSNPERDIKKLPQGGQVRRIAEAKGPIHLTS